MKTLLHLFYADLLLVIITCFVGCGTIHNTMESPEQMSSAVNGRKMARIDNMEGYIPVFPPGMSETEAEALNRRYFTAWDSAAKRYGVVNERLKITLTWQESHGLAQQFLESVRNHPIQFFYHQDMASRMLRGVFVELEPTLEVQKAIGYYADILLEQRNVRETNLWARLLPMLRGYWSDEKIVTTAQQCLKEYQTWNPFRYKFSLEAFIEKKAKATAQQHNMTQQITTQQVRKQMQADLQMQWKQPFPQRAKDDMYLVSVVPESLATLNILAEQNTIQRQK
jgi:hypothetical protein